jgi:hypothetical protein
LKLIENSCGRKDKKKEKKEKKRKKIESRLVVNACPMRIGTLSINENEIRDKVNGKKERR